MEKVSFALCPVSHSSVHWSGALEREHAEYGDPLSTSQDDTFTGLTYPGNSVLLE